MSGVQDKVLSDLAISVICSTKFEGAGRVLSQQEGPLHLVAQQLLRLLLRDVSVVEVPG